MAFLEGLKVWSDGIIRNLDLWPVGELVNGLPWALSDRTFDVEGKILNEDGHIIGSAVSYAWLLQHTRVINGRVLVPDGDFLCKVMEGVLPYMDDSRVDIHGRVYTEDDVCVVRVGDFRPRALTPEEAELMPLLGGLRLNRDGLVYDRRGIALAAVLCDEAGAFADATFGDHGRLMAEEDRQAFSTPPRIFPLPAIQEANELRHIKGCRVQIDGRVRNLDGKVVGQLTAGKLHHSRIYEVGNRGEILNENGGVAGLVNRANVHLPDADCHSDCYGCASIRFEIISYDEQIDLLAECLGLDWTGWPSIDSRPSFCLYTHSPAKGSREHEVDAENITIDECLRISRDLAEGEKGEVSICLIENIDRSLARAVGCGWNLDIEFFYEHYRAANNDPLLQKDLPPTHSHGRKRGTIQGYVHYTHERVARQFNEHPWSISFSSRLSYYWVHPYLLLLLVDAVWDVDQILGKEAPWREWRYFDPFNQMSFPTVIPPAYRSDVELFDLLKQQCAKNPVFIHNIFSLLTSNAKGCMYPDLLYLVALTTDLDSIAGLTDDFKRTSFGEIQQPSRGTIETLHSQRESLKYIRSRLHWAKDRIQSYAKDSGNEDYMQLCDTHLKTVNACIDQTSQTAILLSETFQLLMSSLSAEDNYQSIEQSRKANRITVLAFFYVPLSFVTGIFGMNLNSVNDSPLPYWACIIAGVIVVVLTSAFWLIHYLWGRRKNEMEKEKGTRKKSEKMA